MKIVYLYIIVVFQIALLLSCQRKVNSSSDYVVENNDFSKHGETNELTLKKNLDNNEEISSKGEEGYSNPTAVYENVLYVYADMKQAFRMFGYAKPDTTSKKMILFSIFTYDVKDNPYKCPFGAYYETNGAINDLKITILSKEDANFLKAEINTIKPINDSISNIVYFQKDLINF